MTTYRTIRQSKEHKKTIGSSTSESGRDNGDADTQNLPLNTLP